MLAEEMPVFESLVTGGGRVDLQGQEGHLRNFFQDFCVVGRLGRSGAPGERAVIAHQHSRGKGRVKPGKTAGNDLSYSFFIISGKGTVYAVLLLFML